MEVSNSQPLRVLIVEDDPVTARELAATLRRRGFLVEGTARTEDEAIAMADSGRPQIALVDVRLGEDDGGIRVAARLREDHGVLVIFGTGYSEESLSREAREARPAGFVRKPYSEGELVAAIEAAAQRNAAVTELSMRLPGLEAVADQVTQAILATDLDGCLHYLNRAACLLTGWSAEEALGRPLTEVAPLSDEEGAGEEGSEPGPSGGENVGEPGVVDAGQLEERRELGGDASQSVDDVEPEPPANANGKAPVLIRERLLATREGEEIPVEERSAPILSPEGELVGLVTILSRLPAAVEKPGFSASASDESSADETPEPLLPLSLPDPDAAEAGPAPPVRSSAMRQLAELAQDPAFRKLLPKKPADGPAAAAAFQPAVASLVPPFGDPPPAAGMVLAAAGLLDDVGEPLLRIDGAGRVTRANAEAISVFGGGRSLEGLSFWDRFSSESFERYEADFQRPLVDGRRHRFDFQDSKRGLWFDVRVYPTEGGVLALFNDISAQKVASAEGLRQQRLEGLGLLARGFAHDFNNQLTTITGNISLAGERHPEDADLQQMLAEARTAATRATGLVQQLMTFAQGGRPIRRPTRIPDLIRRILTEQRMQHPEIRYQFQAGEGDLAANIDPAQIGRLVENLVSNSATAMQSGGILVVRSERVRPEQVLGIKPSHNPAEEDHFIIEVIDTGHGMSESALSQVFEPYFTTRKADNASGIGLTVCESIARAHGGFIQLQSKEDKGTIATFCAPLGRVPGIGASEAFEPPDPELAARLEEAAALRGGISPPGDRLLVGTRILILEDDAPIRRLMAATLRRAGHEVVETKDGRETVALYEEAMKRGSPFHLLISDLTIENGMGGVETMRRLTRIDPGILAIVSSGYSDAPAMSSPASFGFKGVLPKPYAPSELRAAVHRILSTHGIIS